MISSISNLSIIFARVVSIWLESSSCDIFMLFNTTSLALEISSAAWAPKETIVSKSLTAIVLTNASTSAEFTSFSFIACLSATMSYCSTTSISFLVSGTVTCCCVVVLLKSNPISCTSLKYSFPPGLTCAAIIR